MDAARVSVIVPTYNRKEEVIRLLDSLRESTYKKIEVIVVDDHSTDGTFQRVKEYAKVHDQFPIKVIRTSREVFLSMARNIGWKKSEGKYLFFIDSDNVIEQDCIRELKEAMDRHPRIGLVAPVHVHNSKKKILWAGYGLTLSSSFFPIPNAFVGRKNPMRGKSVKTLEKYDGCLFETEHADNAFMVRQEAMEAVGPFNYRVFPLHGSEKDFGRRLSKAGYKLYVHPQAKVYHDVPYHIIPVRHRKYNMMRGHMLLARLHEEGVRVVTSLLSLLFLLCPASILYSIRKTSSPKRRVAVIKEFLRGVIHGLTIDLKNLSVFGKKHRDSSK